MSLFLLLLGCPGDDAQSNGGGGGCASIDGTPNSVDFTACWNLSGDTPAFSFLGSRDCQECGFAASADVPEGASDVSSDDTDLLIEVLDPDFETSTLAYCGDAPGSGILGDCSISTSEFTLHADGSATWRATVDAELHVVDPYTYEPTGEVVDATMTIDAVAVPPQ